MKRLLLPLLPLLALWQVAQASNQSLLVEDHNLKNMGPYAECKTQTDATKGNLGYRVFLKSIQGDGPNIKISFRLYDYQCALRPSQKTGNTLYWNVLQQNPNSDIAMKYYDTQSKTWKSKTLTRFERKLRVAEWDYQSHQMATANHKKYFSEYNLTYPTWDKLSLEQREKLENGETIKHKYVVLYQSNNKFEYYKNSEKVSFHKNFSSGAFRLFLEIRLEDSQLIVEEHSLSLK